MIIMADPTIRDFRVDINSLIFSKPVSRDELIKTIKSAMQAQSQVAVVCEIAGR